MKWAEDAIRTEAAKYSSKVGFVRGNSGAYSAARMRFPGLIDQLFGQNVKWTEENIRTEAAKYSSRVEFVRGNSGAYQAARRRFPGLLNEVFGATSRHSWDEIAVRAEAAKFERKVDFQRGSKSAYLASLRLNLIDQLFTNWRQPMSKTTVRLEASKFGSKGELDRGNNKVYQAARKHFPDLLDELFGETFRWTESAVRTEAAKYSSKVEFQRSNGSAYSAALRRFPGLIDQLFANQPKYTDADAFYVWRVEGHWFKGHPVFKVGITSARLGFHRIHDCASKNKVRATDIHLFRTEHAALVEQKFHEMLEVVPDLGFTDGRTEFRSCTEHTLASLTQFATILGERIYEDAELMAA